MHSLKKQWIVHSLKKRWKLRAVWWIVITGYLLFVFKMHPRFIELFIIAGLIAGVLIDEWIKEGYLFKLSDLRGRVTHEQIITALVIIWTILTLKGRRKDENKTNRVGRR